MFEKIFGACFGIGRERAPRRAAAAEPRSIARPAGEDTVDSATAHPTPISATLADSASGVASHERAVGGVPRRAAAPPPRRPSPAARLAFPLFLGDPESGLATARPWDLGALAGHPAARISPQHRERTLTVLWPSDPAYSPETNRAYGLATADAIERTAGMIRSGKIPNVYLLWGEARAARLRAFLAGKQPDAAIPVARNLDPDARREFAAFERERTLEAKTPMIERYAYIEPEIRARVTEILSSVGRVLGPGEFGAALAASVSEEGVRRNGYVLRKFGNPEAPAARDYVLEIPHRVAGYSGDEIVGVRWRFDAGPDGIEHLQLANAMTYHHRDPAVAMKHIPDQIGDLLQRTLAAEDDAAAHDHAFAAYWHLVNAAFDERGSAAKSHYVVQAVLLARGIALAPAVRGRSPDLEALARTLDDWLRVAPQIFGTP